MLILLPILIASAAPAGPVVEHLPAAVALAANHKPHTPASLALAHLRLCPRLPAPSRHRRRAWELEEGEEAAVLVERENLGGATEAAATHEEPWRDHGLLPCGGPKLLPEAPVHGHVPLLEGRGQVLPQRAHVVAVLERLADARSGVL